MSFVAGSFAALLLGLTLLDENLLEVPLAGRNVVWWLALTGILLTASRAFITDTPAALDPERAMAELVAHTHHLPRHWRGRAHTAEVQEAVSGLFQLKLLLFLEELASVLVTPFILGCSLPKCAGEQAGGTRWSALGCAGLGLKSQGTGLVDLGAGTMELALLGFSACWFSFSVRVPTVEHGTVASGQAGNAPKVS